MKVTYPSKKRKDPLFRWVLCLAFNGLTIDVGKLFVCYLRGELCLRVAGFA